MNAVDFLLTITTSAAVTTALFYIIKIYFKGRIQNYFDRNIETFKADLTKSNNHELEKLKAKLSKEGQVELEQIKNQMSLNQSLIVEEFRSLLKNNQKIETEIIERKFKFYPELVETIYRIRNKIRETNEFIRQSMAFTNVNLLDQISELENFLYRYRLDLEINNHFKIIHNYKNMIVEYNMKIQEYQILSKIDRLDEINYEYDFNTIFQNIEDKHEKIIVSLTATLKG